MRSRRHAVKHRWRDYRTASGRRPVKEFIDGLSDDHAAAVAAAMKDVSLEGLTAARHLRGDIYEVRADAESQTYRVLFAHEGEKGRVFLSLAAFSKKTRKTARACTRVRSSCARAAMSAGSPFTSARA